MKKYLCFLLLSMFLFTFCEKDNDGVKDDGIVLSTNSCLLTENKRYAVIDILEGAGGYYIEKNTNSNILAFISNNRIYIQAHKKVNTEICITDKENHTSTIEIKTDKNLSPYSFLEEIVYVKKNMTKKIDFESESDDFIVNKDPDIVSVEIMKDNEIKFTASENAGKITAYVFNKDRIYRSFAIEVVDKYEMFLDKNSVSLIENEEAFVIIQSGNGNYLIESSDETVATAVIEPYPDSLEIHGIMSNPGLVKIKGLKVGESEIKIIDEEGKEKIININVRRS